jgi:hypothetical protein
MLEDAADAKGGFLHSNVVGYVFTYVVPEKAAYGVIVDSVAFFIVKSKAKKHGDVNNNNLVYPRPVPLYIFRPWVG